MAREIIFPEFGPASVLKVAKADEPQPAPGQVRVRVKAAGVNPFDYKLRRGDFSATLPAAFPHKIGNEFAGVVDQVGSDVQSIQVGEEVLGFTFAAAYADFVVVPADFVTVKPKEVDWSVAGALSVAGQTAYHSVRDLAVKAGETLLIQGASGGVGTVAVQLARAAGATVIGTSSARNVGYVESLGAIAIAYSEDVASAVRAVAPDGIDAVLDLAGGAAIDAALELVADRRRIGTVADEAAAGKYQVRRLQPSRSSETLADLVRLHALGALQIPISATYPLEEAAAVHLDLETGHRPGKLVLLP